MCPILLPASGKIKSIPFLFSTYKREASYYISTIAYPFLLD